MKRTPASRPYPHPNCVVCFHKFGRGVVRSTTKPHVCAECMRQGPESGRDLADSEFWAMDYDVIHHGGD